MEWRSLISEDMKSLSLGRIAFWLALLFCMWFWFHPILSIALPGGLLEFLYATLGYNLGKNITNAYQNVRLGNQYGNQNQSSILQRVFPQTQQNLTKTVTNTTTISSQDDITDEDLELTKGKK